jgi:tRNA nucleotidyltransferase (CCA-adding enzyme)
VRALAALDRFGLAQAIHPELGLADSDRARSALSILDAHGRGDLMALALAAERFAADELTRLLDRLAFEAPERRAIVAVATRSLGLAEALAAATWPSEIAEAVGDAPPELVAAAGARGPRRQAERWLTELRQVGLEIDGSDLRAAGIPEGPAVGRGLRAALLAKLDGLVHGREEELAQAVQAAQTSE